MLMTGLAGTGLAGAGAGLGVAMPLGAISVLLVQEAITVGWRGAAGGALGVALVDLSYAVLALLAGVGLIRALAGQQRAVQLGGAAILAVVAGRGLFGVLRPARVQARPAGSEALQPRAGGQPPVSPLRTTGRFVALTSVNPLTAVYFVALAAGSQQVISGPERSTVFLAGVFAASLSWQLLLVTVASMAGGWLAGRARLGTGLVGYLVVLGYAVRLATGAG